MRDTIRYLLQFGMLEKRPGLTAYAARLAERPAAQRADDRNAAVAKEHGLPMQGNPWPFHRGFMWGVSNPLGSIVRRTSVPQLVSVSHFLSIGLSLGLTSAACGSSSSSSPDAEPITGSQVTGTIGALGPAQPIVSSLYIENSGETLIYLSSDTLTCEQLTVSRWLGGTAAGTQVVELVFEGTAAPGDIQLPPGEVNYAPGGMSSAHELGADSGTITFTSVQDQAAVAGSFHASLGSNDTITGVFHATFCANGQGY